MFSFVVIWLIVCRLVGVKKGRGRWTGAEGQGAVGRGGGAGRRGRGIDELGVGCTSSVVAICGKHLLFRILHRFVTFCMIQSNLYFPTWNKTNSFESNLNIEFWVESLMTS